MSRFEEREPEFSLDPKWWGHMSCASCNARRPVIGIDNSEGCATLQCRECLVKAIAALDALVAPCGCVLKHDGPCADPRIR